MKMVELLQIKIGLLCCLSVAFGSCSVATAQKVDGSGYQLIKKIETPTTTFTTDQLRNIYSVTPTNEVIKYNNDGVEQFRYNNNTLGTLAYIDATDPFNLLLFYPDYRTVFLLDRTMNKTGEFNLFNLDVIDVPAVGISNDNNLWIYDDVKFSIKKINRNGETLIESNNLSLVLGKTIAPNFIVERRNFVYINDPEIGILQFDLFGNYVKTLEIKGLDHFQILDQRLIYRSGDQLMAFHLKSLLEQALPLPEGIMANDQVRIEKDRLYLQNDKGVLVYTFSTK